MSQPAPQSPRPDDRPPTTPTLDTPSAPSALTSPTLTEPTLTPATPDTRFTFAAVVPAAATDTLVPSSSSRSRYRALRLLGRGGLGEVFVAVDEELQREVALKEIQARHLGRADNRRRFLLEAEVTGRLEHPGIVPVYGLGAYADGRPYYAMRFIRGDSFEQAIANFHAGEQASRDPGARALEFRDLLRRFTDVCNAVGYAHSKGVLHRDLKPANIMLGTFGETLVVDWGLAKVLHEEEEKQSGAEATTTAEFSAEPRHDASTMPQTLQGSVAGTPAYMSPEQAAGEAATLGPAADVYSLGAILYHLLTGQPPLSGDGGGVMALLERVKRGDFPPPRQVKPLAPVALEAVCRKAMALKPEERYATAKELAADVDHWLADEPVTAYREPLTARVRRWGRRHRALVSSLAALVLTVTVALAIGLGLVNAEKNRTAEAEKKTRDALELVQDEQKKTQQALDNETAALGQSQRAEKIASEQRALALKTIRNVINDIDGELKDRPALQDLRKKLLKQAQEGLKEVARAADNAATIDHQTIWVHFELGGIFKTIDGAVIDAKKQYDLAFGLAKRLADADPANAQAQRDLSVSHDRRGDVQNLLGDTKAALASFQEGLIIHRKLADAEPSIAQNQVDLALYLSKIGRIQLQLGDTKAALVSFQEGLKISRKMASADTSDASAQNQLLLSLNGIGDIQLLQGDTRAALVSFQESLKISRKLADAEPLNARAQRNLAETHRKLGSVQMQLGDTKAALSAYRTSLTICQNLADADPRNAQTQHDLAVTLSDLGTVQLQSGDTRAALSAYQECHAVLKKLADTDPENAHAQFNLAVSHNRIGRVQMQLGDTKAALTAFQASLTIDQKLADADVSNAGFQRSLSISQINLGDVQLQLGDTKAALAAYQSNLTIRKKLADADPDSAQAQRDLCAIHDRLGTAQLRLGDTKAALTAYQAYQVIAQKLADADPGNAQIQRDLAASHGKVGDLLLKLGSTKEALNKFRRCNDILMKLVEADSGNVQTRIDLALTQYKIGFTTQKLGRFEEAEGWYNSALGRLRQLDSEKKIANPTLFQLQVQELTFRLRVCRGAEMVLQDPAAAQKVDAADRPAVLNDVIQTHVRLNAPDKAVVVADLLVDNAKKPVDTYNAACGYSLCVPLADKPETKERYAARAVALLKLAIEKGYKELAHMKKDTDLDALRERDDFKALLKELADK